MDALMAYRAGLARLGWGERRGRWEGTWSLCVARRGRALAGDVVGCVVEVGRVGDGFGGTALGPPVAWGWAEGLGEGFAEPAFEPLADGFGLLRGIGVEEDVDVVRRGGAGAEGPTAAGADVGEDSFDVLALLGSQIERRVGGLVLLVWCGRWEWRAAPVLTAVDGGAGVIVEAGGVGAEGDVPCALTRIEMRCGHV